MNIKEYAKGIQPHLIKLRREFHKHPEVSGREEHTSRRIADELRAIGGYEIKENVGGYGILAILKGDKPGKTVALRADMDALQISEKTGMDFSSQENGVMHACGHDNHITMLLGAARILAEYRSSLCGEVELIFQPSEEMAPVGGSRKMIEEGALDGVDAVFGLHVWPKLPAGVFGGKSGALMAASDHFTVRFHGKSSHAATPDEGIDALVAGSQFVNAVQTIVSRNTDPLKSMVITIGRFVSGTRYNIVADSCKLEGTCRTFDADLRDMAEKRMNDILDGICKTSGCTGELSYERGYMAVNNNSHMARYVEDTARELFGDEKVEDVKRPSMCAEDFAFYLDHTPGAFAWLGCSKDGMGHPLHSSEFNVDEDILWRGALLLAELALNMK